MSHTAVLEVAVHDLVCLQKACQELGAELVLEKKSFKCYAGTEECDHAIRIKNDSKAYEIGVLRISTQPETYELKTDFWQGGKGLIAYVGQDACKLYQAYNAALFEARLPFGYSVTRQLQADGEVVMVAE